MVAFEEWLHEPVVSMATGSYVCNFYLRAILFDITVGLLIAGTNKQKASVKHTDVIL